MNNKELQHLSRMPEFQTIEAFVDDNEDGMFSHDDLNILNYNLNLPIGDIKKQLESYELKLKLRESNKSFRDIHSNNHDRFTGPGSWSG